MHNILDQYIGPIAFFRLLMNAECFFDWRRASNFQELKDTQGWRTMNFIVKNLWLMLLKEDRLGGLHYSLHSSPSFFYLNKGNLQFSVMELIGDYGIRSSSCNFCLLHLHCPQPQHCIPRIITQWRFSLKLVQMTWSLWSLEYCYLRHVTDGVRFTMKPGPPKIK